ncbi:MAG: hydrogenase maturation protease, partial [Deltaproteobacteria bacterium]|nr:hydrogenase maturation protease [Deltaproteobacteria bacterium]
VIVIDAVDINRRKGEVFLLDLDAVPAVKTDDFSLHQVPTSNMLKELRDRCGVEVTVVGCQPDFIPAEIRMEVSENVRSAIGGAADLVRSLF